jgi:hypothetical protein
MSTPADDIVSRDFVTPKQAAPVKCPVCKDTKQVWDMQNEQYVTCLVCGPKQPAPVVHKVCAGCKNAIKNRYRNWNLRDCETCYPTDPLTLEHTERKNWTPQTPKGEDAPTSKSYGYCTECDKIWQECLKLGLKIKTNGIEVTADNIIEGIRALHARAGEARYTERDIFLWLDNLIAGDKGAHEALESIKGFIKDPIKGIKAVTARKEGEHGN